MYKENHETGVRQYYSADFYTEYNPNSAYYVEYYYSDKYGIDYYWQKFDKDRNIYSEE